LFSVEKAIRNRRQLRGKKDSRSAEFFPLGFDMQMALNSTLTIEMKLPQSFCLHRKYRRHVQPESFNFKSQTFLLMVIAVSGKSVLRLVL